MVDKPTISIRMDRMVQIGLFFHNFSRRSVSAGLVIFAMVQSYLDDQAISDHAVTGIGAIVLSCALFFVHHNVCAYVVTTALSLALALYIATAGIVSIDASGLSYFLLLPVAVVFGEVLSWMVLCLNFRGIGFDFVRWFSARIGAPSPWSGLLGRAVALGIALRILVFSPLLALALAIPKLSGAIGGVALTAMIASIGRHIQAKKYDRTMLNLFVKKLDGDRRRPIAFLRPFFVDMTLFPSVQGRRYGDLTLDETVLLAAWPIGPAVALSREEQDAPGARRELTARKAWRGLVADLLHESQAAVVVIAPNKGTQWEMELLDANYAKLPCVVLCAPCFHEEPEWFEWLRKLSPSLAPGVAVPHGVVLTFVESDSARIFFFGKHVTYEAYCESIMMSLFLCLPPVVRCGPDESGRGLRGEYWKSFPLKLVPVMACLGVGVVVPLISQGGELMPGAILIVAVQVLAGVGVILRRGWARVLLMVIGLVALVFLALMMSDGSIEWNVLVGWFVLVALYYPWCVSRPDVGVWLSLYPRVA